MKFIKLFIILIFIVSCSTKETEKSIIEFENILGKENSTTLTYLVKDFENTFLKKKYPNFNVEQAYRQFIIDIESNKNSEWENPRMSLKSRKLFDNSRLKLQVYGITDSVWFESNTDVLHLKRRIKYLKPDGEYFIGTISSISSSYYEVMNDTTFMKKQMKIVDFNNFGKYQLALNSITKDNEFVLNYLETMKESGKRHPSFVAYKMWNAKVDCTDYFIKRLILTEIVY